MKIYISALLHFLNIYITALPRIIYRSTISFFFDFKGSQAFFHDILNAQDLRLKDKIIKSIDLVEIIKEDNIDIKIEGSYYNKKSSDTRDLFELANIAYFTKCIEPKVIFEIGTYIGRTTQLFAINSKKDCIVYTLDLPQSLASHIIGLDFKDKPEANKIVQLLGDSLSFDFSPYYYKVDFVWVDACHDYRYVKSDTQNALKICKHGGWIAWHDYRITSWWSGVTKFLREFSRDYPNIMHIKGTTIAIVKKD